MPNGRGQPQKADIPPEPAIVTLLTFTFVDSDVQDGCDGLSSDRVRNLRAPDRESLNVSQRFVFSDASDGLA